MFDAIFLKAYCKYVWDFNPYEFFNLDLSFVLTKRMKGIYSFKRTSSIQLSQRKFSYLLKLWSQYYSHCFPVNIILNGRYYNIILQIYLSLLISYKYIDQYLHKVNKINPHSIRNNNTINSYYSTRATILLYVDVCLFVRPLSCRLVASGQYSPDLWIRSLAHAGFCYFILLIVEGLGIMCRLVYISWIIYLINLW